MQLQKRDPGAVVLYTLGLLSNALLCVRLWMPLFARRLFLADLDAMCKFFVSPGIASSPSDLKKHVPDALDAEGWFRHHNRYANGEPIVGNKTPPSSSRLVYLVPVAVAVAASLFYLYK